MKSYFQGNQRFILISLLLIPYHNSKLDFKVLNTVCILFVFKYVISIQEISSSVENCEFLENVKEFL